MEHSRWFHRWKGSEAATVRLYCIPHAGAGAATMKALTRVAPSWLDLVSVRLPGREKRFLEPLPESLAQIAEEMAAALLLDIADCQMPVFLMGQCSGAVIALEVAAQLTHADRLRLGGLVVCSRSSPEM